MIGTNWRTVITYETIFSCNKCPHSKLLAPDWRICRKAKDGPIPSWCPLPQYGQETNHV